MSRCSKSVRWLIIAALLASTGCAVRLPSKQERADVLAHKKAILLIRCTGTEDGKPFTSLGMESTGKTVFVMGLANVDRAKPVEVSALQVSPTKEARKAGWFYTIVDPGTWYFAIRPGDFNHLYLEDAPGFLIHVPQNEPLVYAGSVNFVCYLKDGLLSRYFSHYDRQAMTVSNDHELCRELVETSFAAYGPPTTALMMPCDTFAAAPHVQPAFPMAIQICNGEEFAKPDLGKLGAEQGAVPGAVFASLGGAGGPGSGAVVAVGLGVAAVGAGVGAIFGGLETAGHADDFRMIADQITAYDLPTTLESRLTERLSPFGSIDHLPVQAEEPNPVVRPDSASPLLRVYLRRLALQPCKNHRYVLELAVRIQLWEPGRDRCAYDRIYLYSSPKVYWSAPAYELPLDVTAEPRKLKEFRTPESPTLTEQELDRAVDAIVARVVTDLGVEVGTPASAALGDASPSEQQRNAQ